MISDSVTNEKLQIENLYHYTSLEALKGIIEDKEIWLSNVLFCNDRLEIKYFYKILREYFNFKYNIENIDNYLFTKSLYNEINDAFKEIENNSRFFVMSFTGNKDNSSQWYQYAQNGFGVCLEFNINKLSDYIFSRDIELIRVIYDKKEIYSLLNKFFKDTNLEDILELSLPQLSDLLIYMADIGIKCKHPSFVSELEYRIYVKKSNSKYIRTDIDGNIIKQRYIIKLTENAIEDIITSLTLGPKSNVSLSLLKKYLEERGLVNLAKNIKKSESSLC